jgi:hypothetical protein
MIAVQAIKASDSKRVSRIGRHSTTSKADSKCGWLWELSVPYSGTRIGEETNGGCLSGHTPALRRGSKAAGA